jgi:hypothetical protein
VLQLGDVFGHYAHANGNPDLAHVSGSGVAANG